MKNFISLYDKSNCNELYLKLIHRLINKEPTAPLLINQVFKNLVFNNFLRKSLPDVYFETENAESEENDY